MGESNGLMSADAHVDEALVGCIDMEVSDDGSLVPASTKRGAEGVDNSPGAQAQSNSILPHARRLSARCSLAEIR